ncbi:MAG: oxidoreductase [Acetobacteraceae bacterium]|nr:oxidoreductase [Acetobacteraceae bacterium]
MSKPKIAVYKLASCSGCQLQLVNLEPELLDLVGEVEIAYFPMASRKTVPGPYDICFIEGSITREEEVEVVKKAREDCRVLVAMGACGTAGGPQGLKNWARVEDFKERVYQRPDWIRTGEKSLSPGEKVKIDLYLPGCPVSRDQLKEVIVAALLGRKPYLGDWPVCVQCKMNNNVCLLVASKTPCLGPVTRTGCGALCPTWGRGCYGCFGPCEDANVASMGRILRDLGLSPEEIVRRFRHVTSGAEAFREGAKLYEGQQD